MRSVEHSLTEQREIVRMLEERASKLRNPFYGFEFKTTDNTFYLRITGPAPMPYIPDKREIVAAGGQAENLRSSLIINVRYTDVSSQTNEVVRGESKMFLAAGDVTVQDVIDYIDSLF